MSDKEISIAEFREFGYLQEINRQFLHPLGLAMYVEQDEDGNETLGGVFDDRDDPEGTYFAEDTLDEEKALRVAAELGRRAPERRKLLGYLIQPRGPQYKCTLCRCSKGCACCTPDLCSCTMEEPINKLSPFDI